MKELRQAGRGGAGSPHHIPTEAEKQPWGWGGHQILPLQTVFLQPGSVLFKSPHPLPHQGHSASEGLMTDANTLTAD